MAMYSLSVLSVAVASSAASESLVHLAISVSNNVPFMYSAVKFFTQYCKIHSLALESLSTVKSPLTTDPEELKASE